MERILLKIALGFYGISLLVAITRFFSRSGGPRLKKNVADGILFLGVGFHLAAVVTRGILARHFPVASFYESLLFITLTTAISLAVVNRLVDSAALKVGVLTLLIGSLLGTLQVDRSIEPLMPALRSIWIRIHVPSMMISYGAFAVAAVASLLDLATRRRNPKPELEWMTSKLIAFGFIFLTIGILLGAIWANEAWGTYWGWDPKETCALIAWLIYAIYLHGKYVTGWKGTRGAWVAVLGFAAVLFTYLGVSFLLSGLHSYISPS